MKYIFYLLFLALIEMLNYRWFCKAFWLEAKLPTKHFLKIFYWLMPAGFTVGYLTLTLFSEQAIEEQTHLPALVFSTLFLIVYGAKAYTVLIMAPVELICSTLKKGNHITNPIFFSGYLIALLISTVHIFAVLKGVFHDRYDFVVRNEVFESERIPECFSGFRILHFSDLHLGSFYGKEHKIQHLIKLIDDQAPDLLLFTGDLINTNLNEAFHFSEQLKQLATIAPFYVVAGNHDYPAKQSDRNAPFPLISELSDYYTSVGAQFLLNEKIPIGCQKDTIILLGLDDTSLKTSDDIEKAKMLFPTMNSTSSFTILLIHNPNSYHQLASVNKVIDLTLAGHTHGFQYVLKIGKLEIAPVSLKYQYWHGMEQSGEQAIHVTTGLGCIAYPGRVGVKPEICVIELKKKKQE
jgi:uncharacterized protein